MSLIQKTNVTHSRLVTPHLCTCVFIITCVFMFNGQLKLKVLGGRLGSFAITRWSIRVPGSPDMTPLIECLGQQKQHLVVLEGGKSGQRVALLPSEASWLAESLLPAVSSQDLYSVCDHTWFFLPVRVPSPYKVRLQSDAVQS